MKNQKEIIEAAQTLRDAYAAAQSARAARVAAMKVLDAAREASLKADDAVDEASRHYYSAAVDMNLT